MIYKHGNGRVQHRGGNGRFRKTRPEDVGIFDANKEGIVFICNVCGREFVPLVMSGKCCGVDDKRRKEITITPEAAEILDKIAELRGRAFINRQILAEIETLTRQLNSIKRQQ